VLLPADVSGCVKVGAGLRLGPHCYNKGKVMTIKWVTPTQPAPGDNPLEWNFYWQGREWKVWMVSPNEKEPQTLELVHYSGDGAEHKTIDYSWFLNLMPSERLYWVRRRDTHTRGYIDPDWEQKWKDARDEIFRHIFRRDALGQ
jgi:hypothetical protein